MRTNIEPASHHAWTTWNKIAFRFFFIFLSLQILTESFWGNLFGGSLVVWRLGEKIFVPPCLWLNGHIFHFKYIPQTWTTFSAALHTIRDVVYLLTAFLVCVLWTIFDKKRSNYNRLLYWFSRVVVMVLSAIAFAYGVVKLFPVQMISPSFIDLHKSVGDLSPFELLWITFGYGQPYQIFTGFFEMSGAILILFRRTRVAGLLILASVMLNVILLNYTYQIGVLILSFYILLLILFLLAPYARQLLLFFFTKRPVVLFQNEYIPGKNLKTTLFRTAFMLFIGYSFIANTRFAHSVYVRREQANQSRRYSLIKSHVVDGDTLRLVENDASRWRVWSERITDGKRLVTVATMKPGMATTYRVRQDTAQHHLTLSPVGPGDTSSLQFSYTNIDRNNWRLEGVVRQKTVKLELEKVQPDSLMKLLKIKRTIITFDDESDNE